ncbi:MAG: transketolase C-terminal domain-containing protein [Alphaproteobacteria bacterium]|jgi:transketolase|nr:transketolase [Rhodospirillaceae bacterium]MDP6021982.1 transketolase C-terminal domain-containing protein [Alphaproteobacteria bacterium]MDP6254538.1 transketolase C-terminal domain-containing protein [Alphaproteobacteria bacterium]MDP7055680.1 transketolase C-terminal domain-containing protein [Alphaproteobacteria bacterium]MDP7229357.1 transketolase C-terminal domain-containing protein [Alphaproteobacteria bacterium]|tara:strand:+ start:5840 stop:6808 length:969 start_codon:yes stop_codon:yes gene_type:complete
MNDVQQPEWVSKAENQSRLAFGQAVGELAGKDDKVVAISADTIDLFGLRGFLEASPERLIEAGIAEQSAMGIASGLATTGMRPILCGYAPFITTRSLEQLRNDVSYANQRVVIGAACSGIVLGMAGGTHHAVEDLAIMRNMPNMTVVVPADARQTWHAAMATEDLYGPSYIRLGGKFEETNVADIAGNDFKLGKADQLRTGDDVTVIACGALVAPALAAADALAGDGVGVRVLNMHTIKPLDRDAVLAASAETGAIVTAEEHRTTGGLGGAVAELLAQEKPTAMRMIGMPDEFCIIGPTVAVREHYGMSQAAIAEACRDLLK